MKLIYAREAEEGGGPLNTNSEHLCSGFFHGIDPQGPYVLRAILDGQTRYRESLDARVERQEVTPEKAFDVIKLSPAGAYEYHRDGDVVRDNIGRFNAYLMYILVVYGHHINSQYDIGEGPESTYVLYEPEHVELIRRACVSVKVHGPSLYFNLIQGPGRCSGVTENVYEEEGTGRRKVRRLTVGFARLEREYYSVFEVYLSTIEHRDYTLKLCDVHEPSTGGTF